MNQPGRGVPSLSARTLLVLGAVVVLVAAVAAVALVNLKNDDVTRRLVGPVRITSFDGTRLDADVTRPAGAGRHPLVVMGSSYGATKSEYAVLARTLTAEGFVTVSYTQRGFDQSGGSVDLAGAATQRDASSVIDWALRNTAADPQHIGMLGVSYGAGVALLTAARDKRVRAVVALSTWTDLAEAFRPNDTLSVPGLGGLLSNSRADSAMRTVLNRLHSNPVGNGSDFVDFAKSRSPATYLAQINRNRPAIMLANGWQDSLFPPTMLVDFYGKLRTPKRLQMSLGDHTGPEQRLLSGQRSRVGDAALAWLRHYLAGQRNGIDRQQPVQLEDVTTKTVQAYRAWPTPKRVVLRLARPSPTSVALSSADPTSWTATLPVGTDSGAMAAPSQFVPSEKYQIATTNVRSLPSNRALVWAAGPVTTSTRLVGTPRLSLAVSSSAPNASLFVYLYDTAPDGTGRFMTITPLTVTGTNALPKRAIVNLEPIDWSLPAGHQLTVVVDTEEIRWYQAAPAGSTVTVSSDPDRPAELRIPLGN